MKRIDAYGATADKKFTHGSPIDGIPPARVAADWLSTVEKNRKGDGVLCTGF